MSTPPSVAKSLALSRRQLLAAGAAALAMPALARAEPLRLRIGHALPPTHPVHPAIQLFADIVRERTSGAIEMTIFADGLIGQEPELITLAQAAKVDFIKVSASALERTANPFRIFSLPFLFRDRAHWGVAAEQRRDARGVRCKVAEARRELTRAAVAPEVPPLVRRTRPHRTSIASPNE